MKSTCTWAWASLAPMHYRTEHPISDLWLRIRWRGRTNQSVDQGGSTTNRGLLQIETPAFPIVLLNKSCALILESNNTIRELCLLMWNLYSEYTQLVYEMRHGRCNDDSPLGNTIPATNVPGRREPVKQRGVPAASFPMYKLSQFLEHPFAHQSRRCCWCWS